MNAGFLEAEQLTGLMRRILRQEAPLSSLGAYERQHSAQWRRLLGLSGGLKPRPETDTWLKDKVSRILPCLPGSGEDVARLAEQLKLDLA